MDKTFPGSMEKLHDMLQFVRIQAGSVGFDDSSTSKIELAIEEALVNIIRHGYAKEKGMITISCRQPEHLGLKIVLTDNGIPYNPCEHMRHIDSSAPLELRNIGGYGIYLIVKIMDEVDYKYEGKSNVLTLVKYR